MTNSIQCNILTSQIEIKEDVLCIDCCRIYYLGGKKQREKNDCPDFEN